MLAACSLSCTGSLLHLLFTTIQVSNCFFFFLPGKEGAREEGQFFFISISWGRGPKIDVQMGLGKKMLSLGIK
jgi:hypothetical protein